MATFFAHHLSIYIWPKIKTIAKVRLNFLENNKETDKFCPKVDKVGKILAKSSHTVVNSPYFITQDHKQILALHSYQMLKKALWLDVASHTTLVY